MTSTTRVQPTKTAVFVRYAAVLAVTAGYLAVTVVAKQLTAEHYWAGFWLATIVNVGVSVLLGRWWRTYRQRRGHQATKRQAAISMVVAFCVVRTVMGLLWLMVMWR